MTITAIRKILRKVFGARCYRITRDGEIHVYGRMPGANKTGWYFFGWVGDADTEVRIKSL